MRKKARMWRDADDAKLREMRAAGYSNSYIAATLDRAYSSVTGRARRLGLDVQKPGRKQGKEVQVYARNLFSVINALAHGCVKCPSNQQLADRVGISTHQMLYALKHLCNAGDIEIEYTDNHKRRIVTSNGDATAWNAYLAHDIETSPRHSQPVKKEPRKCLSCGDTFHSSIKPALRRICDTCKKTDAYTSGGDFGGMYL